MKIPASAQGALLSVLLIPLGLATGVRAQDFNPINKTTAPPGAATYPDPITGGYNVAPAATQPTEATAPAATAPSAAPRLSTADLQFIRQAAEGGLFEVQAGTLAGKAGQSSRVRHFGRHLASDHTAIDEELAILARSKGTSLPSALDPHLQAKLDALTDAPPAAFDRAYLHAMVRAHRQDIAAFVTASTQADDPDLRAFALRTLPALRAHLQMAEHDQDLLP